MVWSTHVVGYCAINNISPEKNAWETFIVGIDESAREEKSGKICRRN